MALDESIALKAPEGLGEHLGGDTVDAGRYLLESLRLARFVKRPDDEHGPQVTERLEQAA